MQWLTEKNVLDYLRRCEEAAGARFTRAELLGWGVSNVVLRVHRADGNDWVIKQAREKLRTRAEWRSRLERIWREADVQRTLSRILPAGTVPAVIFEDRANYLYVMQAVPADHLVWKAALLRGEVDLSLAERTAEILAAVHRQTASQAELQQRWGDLTVFDELRLDPFYRFVARRDAVVRQSLQDLIEETQRTARCLVLADFSPKNILLTNGEVVLVDFETAHFGDPAFDLGFFLAHLLLKAVFHAGEGRRETADALLQLAEDFWRHYQQELRQKEPGIDPAGQSGAALWNGLAGRCVRHLAGCLLARIDGKSPVDYLAEDQQEQVRHFTHHLWKHLPSQPEEVFRQLRDYGAGRQ